MSSRDVWLYSAYSGSESINSYQQPGYVLYVATLLAKTSNCRIGRIGRIGRIRCLSTGSWLEASLIDWTGHFQIQDTRYR